MRRDRIFCFVFQTIRSIRISFNTNYIKAGNRRVGGREVNKEHIESNDIDGWKEDRWHLYWKSFKRHHIAKLVLIVCEKGNAKMKNKKEKWRDEE